MRVKELIDEIKILPNCKVYPPKGLPKIDSGKHRLPDNIKEFYQYCGGIVLFKSESYSSNIVPPDEFVLANPVIVGELCEEDITSEWYIIVDDGNGDYLTIDLSSDRLGRCYDSYWDRHGIVGECPIIAKSFTELLENLVLNKGNQCYWLKSEFTPIGDAYDGINVDKKTSR